MRDLKLRHFFASVKKFGSYLIVILVSAVLTTVGTYFINMENYLLFLSEVIFVVMLIAVYFVFDYLYHLPKELESYVAAHSCDDIQMRKSTKTITIDKQAIETYECIAENKMHIQNHMQRIYEKYLFQVTSDTHVPDLKDIDIHVDERKISLKEDGCKYRLIVERPLRNGQEGEVDSVFCKFYIPVEIQPNETCTLNTHYRTKAFEKVFMNKSDYTSITVFHKTDKLEIIVQLQKCIAGLYKLDEGESTPDGRQYFEILDRSDQRMYNYEAELKKIKNTPVIRDQKITWVITNPHIGYEYKLYFSLRKK